jgi:AcrR family transcriptional regulator
MISSEPRSEPTRERLLTAALRLFAERGYANVGVGDVERAVGLAPRRGALYRHFSSKEALLEAAVRRYVDAEEQARDQLGSLTGDLTKQATTLGHRILEEMDAQHDITRILEREGDRLPDLVEKFRVRVSERGYAIIAAILRSWLDQATDTETDVDFDFDPDATAVLLAGALVNARRSTWTFGHPPGGHNDDKLVASWAHVCTAVLESAGGRAPAPQ